MKAMIVPILLGFLTFGNLLYHLLFRDSKKRHDIDHGANDED